jgi:hypothetical protein
MKHFIILKSILKSVIVPAVLFLSFFPSSPQPLNSWSTPERLPGYIGENLISNRIDPPYLVADNSRTVHAFNSLYNGNQQYIVYSLWNRYQGWTSPMDILSLPFNVLLIRGALLDEFGDFHIIVLAGNSDPLNVYYSKASAWDAYKTKAWSEPRLVGEGAISPITAILVGNGKGLLVIVYSGNLKGNGLYEIHSVDAGTSWSDPAVIFLTQSDSLWPYAIQAATDENGQIHFGWSVNNIQGLGEAIYYTKMDPDSLKTGKPVKLASAISYEAGWPSIVSYKGTLFVVYNNDYPTTRYMRQSLDGGQTWTEPVRLFSQVGTYGHASFVIDSNNILHMFLGNRTFDTQIHGMRHYIWQNNRWNELEPIITGPRVTAPPGTNGFDPSRPRAIASQGNTILLTWRTDPGAGPNGIWYSYIELDTPEFPISALPTPQAEITQVGPTDEVNLSTLTPSIDSSTDVNPPVAISSERPEILNTPSTSMAIWFGIFPVFLLLAGALLIHRLRNHT